MPTRATPRLGLRGGGKVYTSCSIVRTLKLNNKETISFEGSNVPLSKYKGPHRVGDVLLAKRIDIGTPVFHHAGTVNKVENGSIAHVVDFGPGSAGNKIDIKTALAGFQTKPRVLKTTEEIEAAFPPEDTFIYCFGPDSKEEQIAIQKRIEANLNVEHRYRLSDTNCQYFAMAMRLGKDKAFSTEGHFAQRALEEAWKGGIKAVKDLDSTSVEKSLQHRPFKNENSLLKKIINRLVSGGLVLVCILLLLLKFACSFIVSGAQSFYRKRDHHLKGGYDEYDEDDEYDYSDSDQSDRKPRRREMKQSKRNNNKGNKKTPKKRKE